MTTTTLPPDVATMAADDRDAFLGGLRALEALLAAHTDVPLPNSGADVYFALRGTEEEIRAEIDMIAVALGTRAQWTSARHYIAEKCLGGGVCYRAVAIFSRAPGDAGTVTAPVTAVPELVAA